MAQEDKLMGMRDDTRVYAAHRIDYDSSEDIRSAVDNPSGAMKCPTPGHSEHPVKSSYKRKVVCETTSDKDALVTYLESESVAYTVESISVSSSEKAALEQWGAEIGAEAVDALKWDQAVTDLDKGNITQADFQRGKNPHRSEEFELPKSRGVNR